SKRSA
ncbi:type VI secretion ATPase, ClpV1 family, partial [Vibrio parahaemolyticus AQ3810]